MDRTCITALALLILGSILMLVLYLGTAVVEVVHTEPLADTPASQHLLLPDETRGRACYVTGDLVGDANPAEIVLAVCGPL
jgi:hypothetical protein